MPWWGWVVTGFLLLGAEMFGVDAQFYLVFIGAAAIVVGLLEASGVHLPDWAQWLTFTVLAVGCMALFRARLYRRFRGDTARISLPGRGFAAAFSRDGRWLAWGDLDGGISAAPFPATGAVFRLVERGQMPLWTP